MDRITRSEWWNKHAMGYWDVDEPPPSRVWVWEDKEETGGLFDPNYYYVVNEEEIPGIVIGYGEVNQVPAMADQWVLLHELTHVSMSQITGDGHHGPEFCGTYLKMVERFLGPGAAGNLSKWSKQFKVRMDYGLLLS